ncbi:MAG: peptide chain release factor 3, partial [Pygmaiobacter sp.]|nr:peptide chain release factor 3 [Pygmaiobacter sp.]
FLEDFTRLAPPPGPRTTVKGEILSNDAAFTGFVFKIQANMDPKHRDRLAFVRICSGEFEEGMGVYHTRLKKQIKLSQPQQFLAQERTAVQGSASPGDIVGLFDSGNFRIGDTLCAEDNVIAFEPIPMFPSEYFAEVTPKDSSKRKQFIKGIEQLAVEGAIQTFRVPDAGVEKFIVGVAGALQIEVLAHRMQNEYNTELRIESLPHRFARWITPYDTDRELNLYSREITWVNDRFERPVALFPNEWLLRRAVEKNPKVTFSELAPIL